MKKETKSIVILVADDDLDDRQMIQEAFKDNRITNALCFVKDGEELMDFLFCRGNFQGRANLPKPGLILLDLNMPKKDGFECLKEIKLDPELKRIPVVVLSTSKAHVDIFRSYNLGVNSFVTKPVTFDGLVTVLRDLGHYWLEIVQLPANDTREK